MRARTFTADYLDDVVHLFCPRRIGQYRHVDTYRCVDCNLELGPEPDESSTLISMKYGWRLTRQVGDDGAPSLAWRCPICYSQWRESQWRESKSPGALPKPPGGS
jgi:hypothetical protein